MVLYPRSGFGRKIFVLGSIRFNRESIDSKFLHNVSGCWSNAADGNRRLVFVDSTRVSLVRFVRHDVVVLCVRDGRDGCHGDGRERGEVSPLYLARPWIIKISGNAEAWLLRDRWSLLLLAQPRLSKKVSISSTLFFSSFFVSPRTYFLVSRVDFLIPQSI